MLMTRSCRRCRLDKLEAACMISLPKQLTYAMVTTLDFLNRFEVAV